MTPARPGLAPQRWLRDDRGWSAALCLAAAVAAGFVWQARVGSVPQLRSTVQLGSGAEHSSTRQRAEVDILTRRVRGDRRQTGRSAHVGPARANLRFRFMTRGPITAQPVLGRDSHVHFGSWDGFLYTLDSSGRLVWRAELGAAVQMGALVGAEARVIAAAQDGQLSVYDAAGSLQLGLGLGASTHAAPVETTDGLRVVAAGADLVAFDAGGVERWRFAARAGVYTSAAVSDDNTLYVGAQDGRVYALSAAGRLLWQYDVGADVDSSPVVADDGSVVFGSDHGALHVLNDRGELRWERRLDAPLRAPTALGLDDTVITIIHGLRPRIEAFALSDGSSRWSYDLPRTDSPFSDARSGPLVDAHGNIYVGASDGKLYALDARGKLRFTFSTGGRIDSSPTLAPGGTLYFGSRDGWLYALR